MSELHICRGVRRRYLARVRLPGHRKYIPVGKPTTSYRIAVMRLAKQFAKGHYKRGDVLFWSDYYDPIAVCEIVR